VTIAGTRMISSCSNVVASITCNSDVCYDCGSIPHHKITTVDDAPQ
jgi:hypothetical protein